MENKNKNNIGIWIVAGIIILVIIFYFASKNSSTQTQSTVNNFAEESQACAKSSKDLYDSLVKKYISQSPNSIGNMDYQDHFNVTVGKCFMLETWRGTGLNLGTTEYRIWDVYDNTKLAETSSWSALDKYICWINNVPGCTHQQFSDFVNTRMESNLNY